MRALQLVSDRKLELVDLPEPDAPGEGEVKIRVKALALNHIDVWGWRGMAFAKRKMPLVVGAEAAGEIVELGKDVRGLKVGQKVAMYGALTCGHCKNCLAGRDNLCESVGGVLGFHVDGFARDYLTMPQRLVVPAPDDVSFEELSCAGITFSTVEHMLFDNAKLESGETVLVHAGGSGIGSAAIRLAKDVGATVITTVGDDEKAIKAEMLGADHVINYRKDRFEHEVRKITKKVGVDVVFEHVGADTWNASLLSMKPGARLVTCGSTSGVTVQMNLMQLFQRQYKIFGSFGATIKNVADGLEKMGRGIMPVIDTVVPLEDFNSGLERLESRKVFGKIVVKF